MILWNFTIYQMEFGLFYTKLTNSGSFEAGNVDWVKSEVVIAYAIA